MSSRIHVLCVGDPDDCEATAASLEQLGRGIEVTTAHSGSGALARLDDVGTDADGIDCVVSGADVPGMDALDLLGAVRERDAALPFVLFPRDGSERLASDAIAAGVSDYLPRRDDAEQSATLASRIDTAVDRRRTRDADGLDVERYRTLIETVPVGLFVLDENGTIVWLNDEFASRFRESRAELTERYFPTLIERGYFQPSVVDSYLEGVRTLLSSSNDVERRMYDVTFYAPDGTEHVYDVHTALLPFEDGSFAGTVNAFRDITRQRHYQRELERQNERLESFAGLVSHDLRNPMNVAMGHLELLAQDVDDDHVEEIRWSLSRMEELVDGLLRLAREGQSLGDRTWFSLADIARESWSTVDTGDGTLEVTTDVSVYADRSRVRTLLENLFRNCIEHGLAEAVETSLTVRIGPLENEDAVDSPDSDGFYVADTGPGLPEERESLFEVGYTTTADGTGFGLAIVDEIVTAHGWSITARDASGGGARFDIRGVRTRQIDEE